MVRNSFVVGASAMTLAALVSLAAADPIAFVDPFVGTSGTGHTFPGACVPFGLVQASPETGWGDWAHCSGYQYSDTRIRRFGQTQINGTGCGDLGDAAILPFTGETLPADFSSAFRKEMEKAYRAVKDSLTKNFEPRPKDRFDLLDKYGYYPFDLIKGESVSRTLECAYDDYCASRLAAALGKADDAAFFAKRAGSWRNVYDASTGFMRGRDTKGNWRTPFDPFILGHGSWNENDFTEGNSFQYSWHVMHDVPGLVAAMGGKDAFAKKLDGLCGNDDCGQMSAWYVFSALGFYPVDPISGEYVLGVPQIAKARLTLPNGKTFTVEAKGLSRENKYVKRVLFNGRPIADFTLRRSDVLKGGSLVFEMTSHPSFAVDGVDRRLEPLEAPDLAALAAGTPIHFLCYEFKGRELVRLEEIELKK